VLRQHDLAVIVDRDGSLRKVAVGLRWTPEAERAVSSDRGMRHRSAQRYSHDHRAATVVVVSEDGPVSVFRSGAVVVASTATA
jgi:DNA integrity scanning protein DisA with diadenylate cyclase activity